MGKENNSRWWEFNLVRYLLGTIVGAIIVNVLLNKLLFIPTYEKSYEYVFFYKIRTLTEWQFIFVHLAVGFVFCYIASAPILVFHSLRLNFNKKIFSNKPKKYFFFILISLLILGLIFYCISNCLKLNYKEDTAIFILFLIILIQVILMILLYDNELIQDYEELTFQRDTYYKLNSTYIDSYKHLREHGNAFFILFLEIILGAILYQIENINAIIVLITMWIMPGASIWFFGNFLEKKLY
jgi:hypothetical protein